MFNFFNFYTAMSKNKFEVKAWLKSLIGEDNFSTAQLAQVTELQERIDALQQGNTLLKADLDQLNKDWKGAEATFEGKIKQLTDAKAALETSLKSKETSLTAATSELNTYKTHYEKQNGKGKSLPIADPSGKSDETELEGYDAVTKAATMLAGGKLKLKDISVV